MPSKLLQEVANYCWSKNFLDVFRNFFVEHGAAFENAPPMLTGEHNMEYYNLFQVYLKLYESTLETYLKTLDCSIEEFYRDVRDAQSDCADPYLSTFIDCLLASADYDSFYKVMSKEGAKSLAKKRIAVPSFALKSEAKNSSRGNDNESDGKYSPEDTSADAKGGRSNRRGGDSDNEDDSSDYKRSSHK